MCNTSVRNYTASTELSTEGSNKFSISVLQVHSYFVHIYCYSYGYSVYNFIAIYLLGFLDFLNILSPKII
jgi:hypothetical protein